MANVLLFVDFWNFQLGWRAHMQSIGEAQDTRIAWKDLPNVLISELPTIYGAQATLDYKGTRVFASVSPATGGADEGLKKWLNNYLDQLVGYRVDVRQRRRKTDTCPHCTKQIERTIEKGVDSAIISTLFEGAINDSYDVAILISNDSDLVPAVETIQERLNKQIIHVGFRYGGHHARKAAWGHLELDGDIMNKLKETKT